MIWPSFHAWKPFILNFILLLQMTTLLLFICSNLKRLFVNHSYCLVLQDSFYCIKLETIADSFSLNVSFFWGQYIHVCPHCRFCFLALFNWFNIINRHHMWLMLACIVCIVYMSDMRKKNVFTNTRAKNKLFPAVSLTSKLNQFALFTAFSANFHETQFFFK